ncbi:MAG: acyltransferase, partial [Rhodocyclaceae bacterium]|nr:acyltransferase [Rhodocyclaceae bacterium]
MTIPAKSTETAQDVLSHPKYRPDIDGLRAVAVLAVVAFHAFPRWMPGGFVGVDIFFVISGYLISTILLENLARDTFSFTTFYMRRIRRIFPALAVVLAASFAFGWYSLFADEFRQLGKHMAGGAGFVANLVLWKESGYFDTASELKPLLHLWSLGIEEQFYLIWPLVLWLVWKRKFNLLTVIALLLVASFAANLYRIDRNPVATFYAPHTRFWELLAGSLLAWLVVHRSSVAENLRRTCDRLLARLIYREAPVNDGRTLENVLSFAGFVLLAIGFWKITKATPFPGAWAAVPVVGAFLLIAAGQRAWLNRVLLSNRVAVFFGLISFPLYLWHWPLLAFARVIEGGTPARSWRIAAVLAAIVLATLTWRFIERPLRFGGHGKVKAVALAVVVAALGCAGYLTYRMEGFPDRAVAPLHLSSQLGWGGEQNVRDDVCKQRFFTDDFQAEFCRITPNQPDPAIMLMGDSTAWHFFPGLNKLAQQHGVGVLALNHGRCAAFLGFTIAQRDDHLCRQVTDKALALARDTPSVKTVVLTSIPYWPVMHHATFLHEAPPEHSDAAYARIIQDNLRRTFSDLLARGKHIVFVLPNTGSLEFHPRDCIGRRFFPPAQAVCTDKRSHYLRDYGRFRAAVEAVLAEFPQVRVFDPTSVLCDDARCWAMKDGKLLHRDLGHLSNDGSDLVAEKLWPEM